MFPDSPYGRLEWAIRESLIVFGILLFWVAVAFVVSVGVGLLLFPLDLVGLSTIGPLHELTGATTLLWNAVVPMTTVTAALYVLVRAGTMLIDHHAAE
ncbi:hypothetical protein AB7C87_09960 [Natrarchaeobius sp. A-rgal3]|uniref:hypothetical protein n=1 Tax=Natrarchaeobius versutus TaxID=1679078 RepID=UPI00350FE113